MLLPGLGHTLTVGEAARVGAPEIPGSGDAPGVRPGENGSTALVTLGVPFPGTGEKVYNPPQ